MHRPSTSLFLSLLFLGLLLPGCGGSSASEEAFVAACDGVPGCAETEPEQPRETIWRVLVVRDADGQIAIEEMQIAYERLSVSLPG